MDERARPWAAAFVAAVVSAAMVLAGCSDDDAAGDDESTTTESTASTTTTQPPATATEAVRPVIEELVQQYDGAVAAVMVDPGVVDDQDSPVLAQLESVFTPDALAARVATVQANVDAGRVFTPIGVQPLLATTLTGEITADGADDLQVLACTTFHHRLTGPDIGEVKDGVSNPARIYATRIDGTWRISRTDLDPNRDCDPGVATGEPT